jgi:hypothetical protein
MKQSLVWTSQTYDLGDIVEVADKNLEAKANQFVFTPHTPYLHHFLIGNYIAEENDYVIYESIPSHGVAIGRLSFYDGKNYRVLRLNRWDSKIVGGAVINDVSLFGREGYDYIGMINLVGQVIRIESMYWRTYRKFKAVSSRDVIINGNGLWCTELVVQAYLKAGVSILPPGCAALPSAFQESVDNETLVVV